MGARRLSRRRLLVWLLLALLIVVATGGPGGGRVAHAQISVRTVPSEQLSDGQFILRASPSAIDGIAARLGLTVIGHVARDVYLVTGALAADRFSGLSLSSSSTEFTASALLDPQVESIEPNAVVVAPEIGAGVMLNHSTVEILDSLGNRTLVDHFGQPAWYGYVNQPAAGAIRLADAHATSVTGAGIVAIIDTGVDPNHPLLQGALVPGYDFVHDTPGAASEWSDLDHSTVEILDHSTVEILDSKTTPVALNPSTVALLKTGSALDPAQLPPAFGHGTMVAGIVHLVAPTAKIMPLKAFSADGTSRTSDIVRAIYYAVEHGARVINLSFSGAGVSSEIARAINYATDRGVVCVASVGNLGREVVVYPGGFRNVIGVASSSSLTPPVRSSFSNFGDALVSLAAPGEGIITTYPGGSYAGAWGTSFSTPLVAGGAALLLQIDPSLNFQKANDQFARAAAMQAGMGKGRLNLYEAARTLSDTTAPSASLLTPSPDAVIAADVLVSASASDNVAVAGVKFLLDGSPLGAEDTAAPYEISWPTTTTFNGVHLVTAIARDAAGNVASSSTSVTVSNDFEQPTVAILAPAPATLVSGTVTVSATASDDIGVSGVQFVLDGAPVGAEDVAPPYALLWDTAPVSDGPHTWTVIARDAAGKIASSSSIVTVTHDVTGPTVSVTRPVAEATVSGAITITAGADDDVAVTTVQWVLDGMPLGAPISSPPYQATWSTLAVGNGTHTLTAVARDAVGHVATASPVSFTVLNDFASPTVGLVRPLAGAIIGGVVVVLAAAADDIGVESVQFLLDGAPLGEVDSEPPYQLTWSTPSVANGAHTLAARARDAAGREGTAAPAIVNVRNDLMPPTVMLASPSAGTTVSGAVTIAATAVDDVGVTSVYFVLDGAPIGEFDLEAPYELEWQTTTAENGAHILTVVAHDAAGRETTADAVSVTVMNDLSAPTIALLTPAPGVPVAGVIAVRATAIDDVGVTSVHFLLDGVLLGDADLDAPYEVEWQTTTADNGAHTITAVARDAAGRETTSSVSIVVTNELLR